MTDPNITVTREEVAEEIKSAHDVARKQGETVETILALRYLYVKRSIDMLIRREMEGVVVN
jgi:hypothetical protein